MTSSIKAISRNQEGNIAFAIVAPGGHHYGFSLTNDAASDFAARLLDAVAGKGEVVLHAAVSSLRRDQQQILTALQEVARKVARLEQHLGSLEPAGHSYASEMVLLPDPVTGEIRPVERLVRVDGAFAC